MDAHAFIQEAQAAGLTLAIRGDALTVSPAGLLTEAQRQFIRAHKPALLAALIGKFHHTPEPKPAAPAGAEPPPHDPDPAPILPPPWDAIRDHIAEGWRAVFAPPEPDGRQAITWIPPGAWKPAELHQGEPAPDAYFAPLRSSTGGGEAHATASGPVACGDCRYFTPDPIGDGSGIGACRAGVPARGLPYYPRVERHCRSLLPAGQFRPPPLPNSQDRSTTELRPIPHIHSDPSDFEDTDMALTLSDSGEPFELAPAGTFPARCYRVVDMGTQKTTWQGQESQAKKILLQFEICDPDTRMSDGRAFSIGKRYTASLNEKAALRKDLEAWRGKSFDPQELRGFDVSKLLGQPCLLSVIHVEKGGRMYANINSLMRLPKGMPVAEASNELLFWDFDKPDWNAFEHLGQRMQAILEATPEWGHVRPAVAPPAPQSPQPASTYPFPPASRPAPSAPPASQPVAAPAGGEDFDDDIPF